MKKQLLISFFLFFFLVITSVNAEWCYQESANVSTSCGGLNTGVYSTTGSANDGYMYVNYTKPQGATNNSLWNIKAVSGLSHGENKTIGNMFYNCFSQNPLQFKIYISSSSTSSYTYGYCYDGGTWGLIYSSLTQTTSGRSVAGPNNFYDGSWSTNGLYYGDVWYTANGGFYEEAVVWDIQPISIISPTSNQIFNDDQPTARFNISVTNMSTCYWSPNAGITNYTMNKLNDSYFYLTNTSMLDGNYTNSIFYCNQSSDGTWKSSSTFNFEVDSISITQCRNLNTARTYNLTKSISGTNCLTAKTNNIFLTGNSYSVSSLVFSSSSNDLFSNINSSIATLTSSSNITLYNINLTSESVDAGSQLIRQWYLDTQVNYSGNYLSGALVNIYDNQSNLITSQNTNATGNINRTTLNEYINNAGTKTYYIPYKIIVSATGKVTNTSYMNLTQTNNTYFRTSLLNNVPPVVTLSNPLNNTRSNTILNNYICNSTGGSNLFNATVYIWNSTNYLINSTNQSITGSSNSTNFSNIISNQGINYWNCYVCDNQGMCSWASSNFTLNIDNTNPNATLLTPINKTINKTNQNFTVNLTDNLGLKNATLHIFNSTNSEVNTTSFTSISGTLQSVVGVVVNLADDIYKWFYDVFDLSGNKFTTQNNTFTKDTTYPTINFTTLTPINNSYLAVNTFIINITVNDTNFNSSWAVLNNQKYLMTCIGSNPYYCNYTFSSLANGRYNFSAFTNDTATNINYTENRTLLVDTTYPQIAYGIGTAVNNSNLSKNFVYINTTWTETNFANITFNLYNSSNYNFFDTYTSATYFDNSTNLIDSNYTYNVTICDLSGNCNSTGTNRITLDDTPPIIDIVYPISGNSYNLNTSFNFNFTVSDNLMGVKSCWFTNNSGVNNYSITGCNNFTQNLSDGNYNYIIYANDTLNNIGFDTVSFSISTGPPAISLVAPTNNQFFNNTINIPFNFTVSSGNPISICQLWTNTTGAWALNQTLTSVLNDGSVTNFSQLNISSGIYKWNVRCNDSLNNVNWATSNFTFGIDITYPLISLGNGVAVNFANLSKNFVYINTTWTETNFANITFTIQNSTWSNSTTFTSSIYLLNFTNIANGNYWYYVNITDKSNNKNGTLVYNITLDTINPSSSLISPTNNSFNYTTSQNFTANITDNLGIKNATLYIWNQSGQYNQTNINFIPNTLSSTIGIVVNVVNGVYKWWYKLWDWAGNTFTTSNYTINIDTTYPLLTDLNYTPKPVYDGMDVNISVNINETYISNVWIMINYSGIYQNISVTTNISNNYTYTLSKSNYNNFQNVSWKWFANNSASLTNNSNLNYFIPTDLSPYNVTILNQNNSFINTNYYIINFTANDPDYDILNYSLYFSPNGTNYILFNSTTNGYLNLTGFNTTDNAINYYYIKANDSKLANQSANYTFNIDITSPSVSIIDPKTASDLNVYCSFINLPLNYIPIDTNIDYCTFIVTNSFDGTIVTPLTRINNCINTTFSVSNTGGAIDTLNFTIYDKAGNFENLPTNNFYVNPFHISCSSTPSGNTGGGTTIISNPNSTIQPFCGDGICDESFMYQGILTKKSFQNCNIDCAGFDFDTLFNSLLFNCFSNDTTKKCIWFPQKLIPSVCGDGICSSNENSFFCSKDCGNFNTETMYYNCIEKGNKPCFWKSNLAAYMIIGLVIIIIGLSFLKVVNYNNNKITVPQYVKLKYKSRKKRR
jgi:hypothetical protein